MAKFTIVRATPTKMNFSVRVLVSCFTIFIIIAC